MRAKLALKLVEAPPFFRRKLNLKSAGDSGEAHSLAGLMSFPISTKGSVVRHLVARYSRIGEIVFDPFSWDGGVGLESALLSREFALSHVDELCVQVSRAKVQPADVAEVTLQLQQLNLNRPIRLDSYKGNFDAFYEVDTFRELVNLREILDQMSGRVASFVRVVAASLLHGHSAGYFSNYSNPSLALAPQEQMRLNVKRRKYPECRPIVPRLIRKSALLTRDGNLQMIHQFGKKAQICKADPCNLSQLGSGSVDLIVTRPPLPGESTLMPMQWLRRWMLLPEFAEVSEESFQDRGAKVFAQNAWMDFMNASLFELARILKPGGRACLLVPSLSDVDWNEDFLDMVRQDLIRYWDTEGVLIDDNSVGATFDGASLPGTRKPDEGLGILVLRRK